MIQTDKENIAMGYSADEISAFAVLCDDADVTSLEVREDELQQELDALKFFKTVGGVSATVKDDALLFGPKAGGGMTIYTDPNNPKRIIFDTTGIVAIINALKYFGSIGGVAATLADDSLNVVGVGGITVTATAANKRLTINGGILQGYINDLMQWNNTNVNEVRVESWMKEVEDSPMEGMYMSQFSNVTAWHKYWDEMKSRIGGSDGMWVAFDNEHLCYVSSGHNTSGDFYNYAVHVPFYEKFMIIEEKRDAVTGETTTLSAVKGWGIYDLLNSL